MSLQTDNLAMIGLGVLANQPVSSYQPPLADGIHLCWRLLDGLGFPWHGFYLFRRSARFGSPLCLSSIIGGLQKGNWPSTKHYTAIGLLSSNTNLVLTEDFTPDNQVEFALDGRDRLRFDLPTGEPARRIELHIGFRPSVEGTTAPIKVTAYAGTTPVRSIDIEGQGGQIVSRTIEADVIEAVEIGPGLASLVDLCYVPVAQDATQGWQPLYGLPYPIGLPVSQAAYPCSVAEPQSLLTQRVHYPLPPEWNPSSFTQLHEQLVTLVEGGPNGPPMADRLFIAAPLGLDPSDSNPPQFGKFYVLDLMLLSALHPALAQLLGLYWIDQTAALNVAYDYLIVADHTGFGEHSAETVLEVIQTSGFTQLDGYIVFNKRLAAAPPLPVPSDLRACKLPGGLFPDAQGQLPQAGNNAGLNWDLGWDDSGGLLPERAVMYLVWRADLDDEAEPAPTGTYHLITKLPPDFAKPIMVTEPRLPNSVAPTRPPDWPTVPIHFIDRNLNDRWYGYEVSGIDLFGRHSQNSLPALLRLQDKTPPPIPTAVEASALDPEDPFLQRDAAYRHWYESLAASVQHTLVGLRVRWRWTKAHQQQAPDTTEFRIYFHSGSDLPPAHDLAQNWQERFHVVGYNQYFYSINPTSRNFPKIGGTDSVSVTAASGAKWWAASSDPSWVNITSGSSGNGDGTVTYSVAPNPGAARTGTLIIAGHTFIINQQDASSALPISLEVGAQEDRVYEIFLPLPSTTTPVGLSLNPSLAEPVVYANIGVSAADDKPHTNDLRPTGSWGNRPGNEGHIGPSAKIYRVWRTKPAPPVALDDTERVYASPADYYDRSYYTYRWQTPNQADNLKLHIFSAMDDALFKKDWFIRTTRIALDPGNPQHQRFFPTAWNQNRERQQAAANVLNAISSEEDYDSVAMNQDAQELLACLPGNDGVKDAAALAQRDWLIRRTRANLTAADLTDFSTWNAAKRLAVADELNTFVLSGTAATATDNNLTLFDSTGLTRVRPYRDTLLLKSDTNRATRQYRIIAVDIPANTLTLDEAPLLTDKESPWAIPLYQTLSDNGLRALTILPGNETAFAQITINSLDSYEADPNVPIQLRWRDRRGPDNPDDFPLYPDPTARRAYIDTLDGRSTNRYFYRAAFVDGAHNQGALGLVGPAVYLPNVVPPRAPVITKVLGGDRQITIKWASNREPDLAEYRIYRADNEEATRDLRLMALVHTELVPSGDPAARPAEVSWTETPIEGLVTFYYRLVALDGAQNLSAPSRVVAGRATASTPPAPATLQSAQWIKIDAAGNELPWTDTSPELIPAVRVQWLGDNPSFAYLVQRRTGPSDFWKTVMPWMSTQFYRDTSVDAVEDYEYRVLTRKPSGQFSASAAVAAVGR